MTEPEAMTVAAAEEQWHNAEGELEKAAVLAALLGSISGGHYPSPLEKAVRDSFIEEAYFTLPVWERQQWRLTHEERLRLLVSFEAYKAISEERQEQVLLYLRGEYPATATVSWGGRVILSLLNDGSSEKRMLREEFLRITGGRIFPHGYEEA